VFERFVGETRGYTNPAMTAEDLQANLGCVTDRTEFITLPDIRRPSDM
jgi:hypothetical protein